MKPGIKTTELWLAVLANALVYLGGLSVPDKYKVYTTIATTVGYAIARGLAKLGPLLSPTTTTQPK